ncbi:Hypothetical protein NTJ_13176 [Nesidiocoris tenuis]|uniref:Secreted protein n=1 Tax=Nesidiocoris tenuis TaxID=355587 RepID=A0ABN7B7Z4_9HEMI|nr:Hypothetical protein NTJ_13176 [Nesidiocoris tenuis]
MLLMRCAPLRLWCARLMPPYHWHSAMRLAPPVVCAPNATLPLALCDALCSTCGVGTCYHRTIGTLPCTPAL